MVDEEAAKLVDEYFAAVEHPCVEVEKYAFPDQEVVTAAVPSDFHWQSSAKLWWPTLVGPEVTRLVNLDLDVLVLGDVCRSHDEFDKFGETTVAGFTVDLAPFYEDNPIFTRNNSRQGPDCPGAGLNGGVVLWNVAAARALDWGQWWEPAAKASMHELQLESLPWGDQGVFNILAVNHSAWFQILPDTWNLQLIANRVQACVHHHAFDVIILHGNVRYFDNEAVIAALTPLLRAFRHSVTDTFSCHVRLRAMGYLLAWAGADFK